MKTFINFILIFLIINFEVEALIRLKNYNVKKITVSGFSAGAAMATQMHISHSSIITGSGIIAGPPYHCAFGSLLRSTSKCLNSTPVSDTLMPQIYDKVSEYLDANLIDCVENLKNHRVYLFSGKNDQIILPEVVKKSVEFFKNYVKDSNVMVNFDSTSNHGMVTDFYGGDCESLTLFSFINNCNFNLAFELLQHIHPDEVLFRPEKGQKIIGQLLEFDQTEFFKPDESISLDNTGFVYIPDVCKTDECKLHVVFHSCMQGKSLNGSTFAENSGYNQVADLNKFIILYPQVVHTQSTAMGCFDWWGYSGNNYDTKKGMQIKAIKAMIDKISEKNLV